MTNTDDESPLDNKQSANDLDGFSASPSAIRLDDKAAVLERDLVAVRSRQANERVIFTFALGVMFCVIIGLVSVDAGLFWFTVAAATVLNIEFSRSLVAPLLASML